MRAAITALVTCLILLQAPAPAAAQQAPGRSAKAARGAQKKQAKAPRDRAKAPGRRHRSLKRGAIGAKKKGARLLRRALNARSGKRLRGWRKTRGGAAERGRNKFQRKIGEVKSLLVRGGVEASRADKAAEHVALGLPGEASPSAPESYLLAQPEYVVSYNRSRKVPNWSSWKLSAGDFGDTKRHNRFRRDGRIPDSWNPASKADYKRSGFTRGHLVPSGARTASKKSNKSTFVLSNIVPQTKENNGGAWHTLEKHLHKQVQDHGKDVYVSAGPIFRGKRRTIGENNVAVPNALWKVAVIVPKGTPPQKIGKDARVLSVIVPNNRSVGKAVEKFRVKPKRIEKQTGLRFFEHLPKDVRSTLRNKLDREQIAAD